MIIFSFDCAVKTLAFCCVKYKENYIDELKNIILELKNINEQLKKQSIENTSIENKSIENINNNFSNANSELITQADYIKQLMKRINTVLDNRIELIYINVFDLIPSKKLENCNFHDVLINLKYVLHCLNHQLEQPDIILIEYQMNANDKSRGISRYIEGFYTELQAPTEMPKFAFSSYPMIQHQIEKKENNVHIINPNLKNAYQIDPSEKGAYSYYIQRYTNKSANKKHTVHNFIYYLNQVGKQDIIKNVDIKLDDAADAFIMSYSWLKKLNYI
jgi:hypothetical protein